MRDRFFFPNNLKADKNETDYIEFSFYTQSPPLENNRGNNIDAYRNNLRKNAKLARGYPMIDLYMPEDISTTYRSNWEGKAFGEAAKFLFGSNKFENITDAVIQSGLKKAAEYTAKLSETLGDKINVDDIFALRGGVVTNPNTELLFRQQELRTFRLKFKFTPTTEKETEDTKKIINTFKKASLPKYGGEVTEPITGLGIGNQVGFVTVPKLCEVKFKSRGEIHPYLPKYNLCAITNISANYTPDNKYSTFVNSSPVATELTINFLETKLQYSDDIEI